MVHHHIFLDFARADSNEGNPVAVLGIHVGLQLEHEARKLRVGRLNFTCRAASGSRPERIVQKCFQKQLDPKVGHRTTKKHRRHLACMNRL